MTRVVCYIRQSDEEGHKKELSCPFQQDRFLQDIAPRIAGGEEIEYEIAPWDQGKSGGSVDREGLQWVLANLDRFQEIWVYDHDRLIRHAVFGPWVMGEIRQRGVRLWGPWGEDAPTPMGRFMTDVRMRFGAFYREESSDRTKENLAHRLREGLWMNHAPAGYKFQFENGEGSRRLLVPDPQTAQTVQQLFRMMAAGVSQKRAAQELGLNATTILWWRSNPLYIGLVYKYRKNVNALKDRSHFALWALAMAPGCDWLFPGRHEPLIDAETWDKLQASHATRSTRGRPPSARLALSGLITCECGRKMIIHRMKGNRYPAVRCQACGWLRSYQYAENTVLSAIALVCCSKEYEQEVEAEIRKRRAEAQTEDRLSELSRRREQMHRKLSKAIDAMLDAEQLVPALKDKAVEYQNAVAELDREIAHETATLKGRTTVGEWRDSRRYLLDIDVPKLWEESSIEEQRAVLRGAFAKIVATPAHLTFHVHDSAFPVEIPWQTDRSRAFKMVAGAGFEPATFGL